VAVQPNPFAPGETIVLPRSDIALAETGTRNIGLIEPNVNLSDLIDGLNRLGVAPSDIADVLRAIHATGAIQAELVIR
jgi:flagellar P-ring protein precursor FlgI